MFSQKQLNSFWKIKLKQAVKNDLFLNFSSYIKIMISLLLQPRKNSYFYLLIHNSSFKQTCLEPQRINEVSNFCVLAIKNPSLTDSYTEIRITG